MDRGTRLARIALGFALVLSGRGVVGDDQQQVQNPSLPGHAFDAKLLQQSINLDFQDTFQANSVLGLQDGVTWLVRSEPENNMGIALTAVDEAARVQLGIHAGQGLVVSNLSPNGPAAKVGLKANDILLTLGDKFLGKPEDLTEQLKAAGESPVKLHVLRSGKPFTLTVKPVYRVTLGEVAPEKRDYFIGVPVQTPDETLRAHLPNLPEGSGLIATGVEQDSPASKAGIKPYDILLELDGKRLTDMQSLITAIQATAGREASAKILRAGKELTLKVTPELRKQAASQANQNHEARLLYTWLQPQMLAPAQQQAVINWTGTLKPQEAKVLDQNQLETRLHEVAQELKTLREELSDLKKSLKKN